MRTLLSAAAILVISYLPASGADRGFRDVVQAISDEFHVKPLHIPFFGLVNMVAFVARPAGARHIDLAVFEDLDQQRREGRDVATLVRGAIGRNWKPFVQVVSKRGGREETTLIYMREDGRDTRLLITAVEPDEATVVQLKLNMDRLARWLCFPREWAFDRYTRGSW